MADGLNAVSNLRMRLRQNFDRGACGLKRRDWSFEFGDLKTVGYQNRHLDSSESRLLSRLYHGMNSSNPRATASIEIFE